jgi:hypothetical protein
MTNKQLLHEYAKRAYRIVDAADSAGRNLNPSERGEVDTILARMREVKATGDAPPRDMAEIRRLIDA